MKKHINLILCLFLVGCTRLEMENTPNELFLTSWDLMTEDRYPITFDFGIDTTNPNELSQVSENIIKGKILGVEGVSVNDVGIIETTYQVKVEESYKGETESIISVSLPGGTTTMGEYIRMLDERGIYELIFPNKNDDVLIEKGIDPTSAIDPREEPEKIIVHNLGNNPTSPIFVRDNKPESYIFYLNSETQDVYYSSVIGESMKYVKNNKVYSPEETPASTEPFMLTLLKK